MQLKKLPYALAVGAATRHPHFACCEMAHQQLNTLAGRKLASSLTTLEFLIPGANCLTSVTAYMNKGFHSFM
jgi:hypothetical protein